jgi:hypothetical protein
MRISYQRTGGFAGMVMSFDVQTETLPADEANDLKNLVDAAGFFDLPSKIVSDELSRDKFQYQLTITTEDEQHTVEVGDAAVPNSLWPLLEKLRILSRK